MWFRMRESADGTEGYPSTGGGQGAASGLSLLSVVGGLRLEKSPNRPRLRKDRDYRCQSGARKPVASGKVGRRRKSAGS